VARDLRGEADDLERRLWALGIRPGAPGVRGAPDSGSRAAAAGRDVAGAIEQIRRLVEGLAELQGGLQAVRTLKERLDRPRPPRAPDR
jgi:hypothetical protein